MSLRQLVRIGLYAKRSMTKSPFIGLHSFTTDSTCQAKRFFSPTLTSSSRTYISSSSGPSIITRLAIEGLEKNFVSCRHYSSAVQTPVIATNDVNTLQTQKTDSSTRPQATRPAVAYHLFFCAALVYLIIVVGGLTRLTESGLSITEWNPGFKGMRLPWTDEEWNEEWEKYRRTPEWAVLNRHMTVHDFKKIYMWEWSHRIIGRLIGVAFVVPSAYFLLRGSVARGTRWKLFAIALGIGFQGALGWFMVQSGLSAPETTPPALAPSNPNSTVAASMKHVPLDGSVSSMSHGPSTPSDWHPRVSHFRLAAHLGTAFLVYLGMLHTGMAVLRDHQLSMATTDAVAKDKGQRAIKLLQALLDKHAGKLRNASRGMLGLTFVTAMTGALVAGLDAGLVYSEFPYMGDGFIPPSEELLDARYATNDKHAGLVLGNVSQNPVTVQLIHRCMAVTTLLSAIGLALYARRMSTLMSKRSAVSMPSTIPKLANFVALAAIGQASLGISTLIYLVPIELASAHQAGSVALLSAIVLLLGALRKPNSKILQQLQQQLQHLPSRFAKQATVDRALHKVLAPRSV